MTNKHSIYLKIKKILDKFLAAVALIISAPLFLTIALAIRLESEGPIFFRQKRVGQGWTFFSIYKFRTMSMDAPKEMPTHLLKNPDQYMTRVGKLIRRCGLDELPQLLNILKGDMSLIGPRPALWNQEDLLELRQEQGVNALPVGLTGWAQIQMNRSEIAIAEKVELDHFYVEHFGFWMDLVCIWKTIGLLLRQLRYVGRKEHEESIDRNLCSFHD